jgi:hypothetical protein
MATIASRPQVIEIEPQVRPLLDRYLMVGMMMALAARECPSQLFHDLIGWRHLQPRLAEDPQNFRFPSAINTPPGVTLEAQYPQSAVMRVVPAFGSRTAAHVLFTLPGPTVSLTAATLRKLWAAWHRARAENHKIALGPDLVRRTETSLASTGKCVLPNLQSDGLGQSDGL